MSVPCEKLIPFSVPSYDQLLCDYDADYRALWHYMHPRPRACFTVDMLQEMRDVQEQVSRHGTQFSTGSDDVRYLVLASAVPSIFNLGGDLDLFFKLISNRDRNGLRAYADLCIDCVYGYATHAHKEGLMTIALVQGKALGGGFEAALSCNVLVAERGAKLGFPEILFNLFPGMGAYSFLVRRLDPIRAERFMQQGEQYSAEELYDMGVVDVLAENGEGVHVVREYIRRRERVRNGMSAIQRIREESHPVTREELDRIATLWVETAMQITSRDLRTMLRLTSAQHRLHAAEPVSTKPQIIPFPFEDKRSVVEEEGLESLIAG